MKPTTAMPSHVSSKVTMRNHSKKPPCRISLHQGWRLAVACWCLLLMLPLLAEEKTAEEKPAPKPAVSEATTSEAKPAESKPDDTKATETPPTPPTEEQLAAIVWEEYAADNTWICPFARDFGHIDEFPERKKDWEDFLSKFALWAPGHVFNLDEKVRNLISAAALMDIGQGQFESELPLFVYQRLRLEVPDDKLKAILGLMAFYPDSGTVIATAPELDLHIGVGDDQVRERLQIFAVKMLGRMLEKLPLEPPTHP